MPARQKPLTAPYLDAGGGRRWADLVVDHAPEDFGQFFEPFLGGGAVAIALMERFPDAAFHLSSEDAEVATTWQVLASDVDTLVTLVAGHREQHSRSHLAAVRAQGAAGRASTVGTVGAGGAGGSAAGRADVAGHLSERALAERAARFIYLRGASERDGSPRETVAFDESNARRLSVLLRNRDVRIETRSFFSIVAEVGEEDLVYLDPPFAADSGIGADPQTLHREIRSLVGTVTARGAYLLAPGPPADGLTPAAYAGWNTMALAADRGDGDTLWANRTLSRALRR